MEEAGLFGTADPAAGEPWDAATPFPPHPRPTATSGCICSSTGGRGRSICCSIWPGGRRWTCGRSPSSRWSTNISEHIEQAGALRLELAADYLVMAAWLAYLKSALLLPREEQPDPDPEELALRLQLRLQRLAAMREAAARLMARDRLGRDVFARGAPEGLRVLRVNDWHCEWYDLVHAYGQVRLRTEPVVHMVRERLVVTLESALERVAALLGVTLDWLELRSFLPPSVMAGAEPRLARSALASSFVAALELARRGRAELRQEETFGPLHLRRLAG